METPEIQTPPKPVLPPPILGNPSPKQQSLGALISIIIIVLMIVIGAFYSWGKRIAEERTLTSPTTSSTDL